MKEKIFFSQHPPYVITIEHTRRLQMRYQTSFYVHILNFDKLYRASQRTGKPIRELILQIMYHYAKDHNKMHIQEGTVKYQNQDMSKNWKVFRISLERDDYELFTDMRKVMKKSVSFLIALAIKKYLDRLIETMIKELFNYTYLIYRSGGMRVRGFKLWILGWRFDRKKTQRINQSIKKITA